MAEYLTSLLAPVMEPITTPGIVSPRLETEGRSFFGPLGDPATAVRPVQTNRLVLLFFRGPFSFKLHLVRGTFTSFHAQ
jgi:hypothetical protein